MTDTPRVALLLADLGMGGAERVMLMLAAQFVAQGVAVDLVLLRATGALIDDIPAGVRVVTLTGGRGEGKSRSLALAALFPMRRYLRRERPQAILSTLTGTNLFAVIARALAGVPTRLLLREAAPLANTASRRRRWLMRALYRHADGVVAVARGVADDLRGLGVPESRLRVIHNPVDLARLREQAADVLPAAVLPASSLPLVLSVGRLVEQKDFGTLIRAFARVRHTLAARLLIIGEGPCRPQLQALVRELGVEADVLLPGHVANPYPAFLQATVFALSSRSEGYPNALLEALALGVPVVATDCEHGPREILAQGRGGRLVPVGDVAALAAAIEESLRLPAPPVDESASRFEPPAVVATRYLHALLGGDWPRGVAS